MPDLTIQLMEDGTYTLTGRIDSQTDLTFLSETKENPVILNLKEVAKINSIGVRKWMDCLRTIQTQGKSIEYLECSEAFLMQCNMVPSFTKDVEVRSFYVPFYCENCRNDIPHLLLTAELGSGDIPTIPCPICGADMTIDDDSILDFLNT